MSYLRAFSSLGCPELSLTEILALASNYGLNGVELRAMGGTVELPAYLASTFGSPESLAHILRAQPSQPKIFAFGTSFRLISPPEGSRDALLDFVPWAEALGVRWLRVFDGGRTADDGELDQAAETIRWWKSERARRAWTVDVIVETHDSLFTAKAIERFESRAPATAILWDTHHTWKRGGEDPLQTWKAVSAWIAHIHVKDSVSTPSGRLPFTYVLPGTGEFPATALFHTLREQFSGPVSLEWEKLWHPQLPELSEALRSAEERNWW